ncbi:MAG: response regulator transcription factor [Lachnospiraceae bacterium]|nr:response regulator transcription factor [Lachnospiraceae bacterium]
MIKFFLCDDEPIWLKKIEHAIITYQVSSDWDFSIAAKASSPDELLVYIKKQKPSHGIYFLDVDYKTTVNGMDLGKEIRQLDSNAFLIYVTTHEEMAMETFRLKLQALDYIIKDSDNFHEQIHQCLHHIEDTYISRQNTDEFLKLQMSGSHRILLKKDIYYIKSQKGQHKLSIHTAQGVLAINASLSALQQKLGQDFILCSKGCLVNVTHIIATDHTNKTLTFDNGEVCLCSIRMWKQLKEALHQ